MNNDIFCTNINNTYIFIDGSYFCFHRYYSLINWWKSAFPENPLEEPFQNEVFLEKFKTTFLKELKKLTKNLNIDKKMNPLILVGKDCKRENIWRNNLLPSYKSTRLNNTCMIGPFFKMVYEENLFEQGGVSNILHYDKLEADDCIAISVKYILNKTTDSKIYIITSDKDYLQLACPQVNLYNLSFKKLTDQKSCLGNPEVDLFCKIVSGDVSDNIPSVLKKCGEKTAFKCFYDRKYFLERIISEKAEEKYNLNKKLIDFNEIPEALKNGFINKCILLSENLDVANNINNFELKEL
jgi:5'-3' exonuclease